jgi:hypothetical protein
MPRLKRSGEGQNNARVRADVMDGHEWSAAAGKGRVPHRAAPAYNIIIMRISPVREFDEHVGVAALGRTPAHEILAAQFV